MGRISPSKQNKSGKLKHNPDLSKLRTERRPRSEKYFDTSKYPIFEGTRKEYLELVNKYIKTKKLTTEQFAQQIGTLREPLDPKKYPNVDITPEMVAEGDLFTSRKSKSTQSAYETSNTKNHRAKSMEMQSITETPDGQLNYHTFQDGVASEEASGNLVEGRSLHHRRGLNQYRPFFEGLNQDETIELATWFEKEGYPVGNHLRNLISLTENEKVAKERGLTSKPIFHQGASSIHTWQAGLNIEPLQTHKGYKDIVKLMEGKNVSQRIPFIMQYLEQVQDPIEGKLGSTGSYAQQNEFNHSLGEIQSGSQKGQRLPRNRRTLGDAIINELQGKGPRLDFSRGAVNYVPDPSDWVDKMTQPRVIDTDPLGGQGPPISGV